MAEPLVKQIVDLKDEHSLMLEALKYEMEFWDWYGASTMLEFERDLIKRRGEVIEATKIAIKAAEDGNERRKAVGNVDLPDKRGMKG